MVKKRYYDDSYETTCSTRVCALHENAIELEETNFYPTGGGQPGDVGEMEMADGTRARVIDTRFTPDRTGILHVFGSMPKGLDVGDEVKLHLDWERRYKHMRMHTALHLLGSLIPESVTGGAINDQQGRLDFDVRSTVLDKEQLTEDINKLVARDLPVSFETITEKELDENPQLVRTMSVQPPRGFGDIRMVRIEELDYQPCGGTHVGHTAEVGPLAITKIRSKGKQNKRVVLQFAKG